jgi:hypothetical protein
VIDKLYSQQLARNNEVHLTILKRTGGLAACPGINTASARISGLAACLVL